MGNGASPTLHLLCFLPKISPIPTFPPVFVGILIPAGASPCPTPGINEQIWRHDPVSAIPWNDSTGKAGTEFVPPGGTTLDVLGAWKTPKFGKTPQNGAGTTREWLEGGMRAGIGGILVENRVYFFILKISFLIKIFLRSSLNPPDCQEFPGF